MPEGLPACFLSPQKTMNDLNTSVRHLFAFPPSKGGREPVELRALTHGLLPKAVGANLQCFVEEMRVNGVDAWNQLTCSKDVFLVGDEAANEKKREFGLWHLPEVIGDRFISRLLNVPQGTCIMMPSATQIVFGILSCPEIGTSKKRKIVCTDGEFPAVLHTLHNYNRRFAQYSKEVQSEVCYEIEIIEMGSEPFDVEKIMKSIDEETCLVIFSHVGFVRGERVTDAAMSLISEKCKQYGALLVIDGYHAIGSHPTDAYLLGVDLYFGGLLKEGCGSTGNCYLYIRKGLELTPTLSGWFGDKQPFAFLQRPEPHPEVRRRFLTGTVPVTCFYHGLEGLKIILQHGLREVSNDILSKVEIIVERCLSEGMTVLSPIERERMSAMIVLEIEEAEKFRDFLREEYGILVDSRRNKYVRLAPHIYNSFEEISLAAEAIVESAKSRIYLPRTLSQKAGPVT